MCLPIIFFSSYNVWKHPTPDQPPTRVINTVSVAQGGTATPGATKQLLSPDWGIIITVCKKWAQSRLKNVINKMRLPIHIYLICMYKQDLALNNLQLFDML